jgi:hypothetical protein
MPSESNYGDPISGNKPDLKAHKQYSNQSMRIWYNPISDKPVNTLFTAGVAAAEPVGGQRAEQGGPCARIGSRREPRAWA